jgi:hypothetical protein
MPHVVNLLCHKLKKKIASSVAQYPPAESNDDSHATKLVKLAGDLKLFHNPYKDAYVIMSIDDHEACWPLITTSSEQ